MVTQNELFKSNEHIILYASNKQTYALMNQLREATLP